MMSWNLTSELQYSEITRNSMSWSIGKLLKVHILAEHQCPCKHFSVCATSTPLEPSFSKAKPILPPARNRLSPQAHKESMLVPSWKPYFEHGNLIWLQWKGYRTCLWLDSALIRFWVWSNPWSFNQIPWYLIRFDFFGTHAAKGQIKSRPAGLLPKKEKEDG